MKAIVQDTYGSPDVLKLDDIPTPASTGDEVLVRVRAASVNPPDWCGVGGVPYVVRAAFGLRRPRNPVRGTDLAGVVEAVGPNVTKLHVGDKVFGSGKGAFAEYAVASEDHLATMPANVAFEDAAAIPMSGLVALHALRDVARVQPGHRVLITGAGGGVGTFAVQIAKSLGAEVTAVCGTTKVDLVESLGADHIVDYTREDFTESPQRYDVILDNVLDHSLRRIRRALEPGGTLVPNGGQFHKRWFASTGVMFIKAPILSLLGKQRIRPAHEAPNEADLTVLKQLVESGKVKPIVGRVYPLAEAADAIRSWGEGHARGKIVITV